MIVDVDLDRLADLAAHEAQRHAPRTAPRRCAAAAWAAIITSATIGGALAALPGFTSPAVADEAATLIHRLAARATVDDDADKETTP